MQKKETQESESLRGKELFGVKTRLHAYGNRKMAPPAFRGTVTTGEWVSSCHVQPYMGVRMFCDPLIHVHNSRAHHTNRPITLSLITC